MTTPTTAAGRALLDKIAGMRFKGDPYWTQTSESIAAIEAEARQRERERIRAAIGPDMYASLAPYIRAILDGDDA